MSFRRRTYPEVLDNLLTDIAGGVAAEPYPFPPEDGASAPFQHRLERPPVAEVASVWGSRDGQPRRFRRGTDYVLQDDQQTLEWLPGAELPDSGSLLYVNYLPASAVPVLTDLQTGSVVRTLAESMGLEIARLYAQLEAVYRSGFIDTAAGAALDNVVALLGVDRVDGGRAAGEIEFTRAGGTRGAITIPAGSRILTGTGEVEYETTETITLAPAQRKIRVVARDLESNAPVAADTLTVLATPIAGIASVTNPAPAAIATEKETDAELRARAKNFLHGSERATLGALRQAIARQQITADVVEDEKNPGYVTVTPHVDVLTPELEQRLRTAIRDTRPAGVVVTRVDPVPPRRVNVEMLLTSAEGLTEPDLREAQHAVRDRVEEYFARLPVGENGSVNRLVGLILGIEEVEDVRLVSITIDGETDSPVDATTGAILLKDHPTVLGTLQIADPSLPTALDVVIPFPASESPPDEVAIKSALGSMVAYVNAFNATEPPPAAALRALSFGKLLRVLPLPNKPGASLQEFDGDDTPPALPMLTEVAPFQPRFAFTLESGHARVLEGDGEEYTLTPFERLSLAGVTISPEAD